MKKILVLLVCLTIASCGKNSVKSPQNLNIPDGPGQVTLAWEGNAEDEELVKGFRLYYGESAEPPFVSLDAAEGPSPIDVSKVLTYTVNGLKSGNTYYFTVTAYDASGYESAYSNVVSAVIK